jgi:predicted PurR-regulated permease PerM
MPFQDAGAPSSPNAPATGPAPARGRGAGILLVLACIVVVAAGVREAGSILTPILAAAFIAMIAILPLSFLQGRLGVPRWLALLIVLAMTIGGALGVGYYLSQSAAAIKPLLPEYEARIDGFILEALNALKARGVEVDPEKVLAEAHNWKIADFADVIVLSLAKVLQNFLFVLLVSAFIIAEASSFPAKLRVAFPSAMRSSGLGNVADKIRSFLVVITELNLVMAAVNWVACTVIGVPFAFLLSFLVFFLNYIPTIGSIAASLLVIAIALVTQGWGAAIAMAAVHAVLGVVVGSILQPRMLGSRLGLSPLVVLLSLVIWGYLLGVAGMFFAVPLTIIVKIVLDSTDDLRSLSVLLGDAGAAREAEKR